MALRAPGPSRQIAFHQLLVGARKTWLQDALREAVAELDPAVLREELARFVPDDAQRLLARAGVRDEEVFPSPAIIEARPTLVGYYRLLLGVPQKGFYVADTGMTMFKRAEEDGILTDRARAALDEFCQVMCEALAELVRQLSPTVTTRDVSDLQLLTLGQKYQGSLNNIIGREAT